MKTIATIFALAIFLILSLNSFAQNYIWARNISSSNAPYYSTCIASDKNGNVYTAGHQFSKQDSRGNTQWVQSLSINVQNVDAICCDNYGNIYLAGGLGDIAKYDTSGNFIWKKNIDISVNILSINADDNGDIILGGTKHGFTTVMFGTLPITINGGFTAKYDTNGNAIWVSMGTLINASAGSCYVSSTISDHSGNYYSLGSFGYDLYPYPGTLAAFGTDTLSSIGYYDAFIIKYSPMGNVLWIKVIGDAQNDGAYEIGVDSLNNAYILRYTSYNLWADTKVFEKYDPSGNLIWTKKANGNPRIKRISVNKSGNIYFAGSLNSNMILNNDTLTSRGSIVGKLDNNGNTIWITPNNASTNNYANDISSSMNGNTYVTGRYDNCSKFGQNLLCNGGMAYNYYVALLNDSSFIPPHKNLIKGNIYKDFNNNCLLEIGEDSIPGFSVMAQPGNYFTTSNIFGNYSLVVDSGIYYVSQLLPLSHSDNVNQTCPVSNGNYVVNAQSTNTNYSGYSFANIVSSCAVLQISIESNTISQCNSIQQTIATIYNYGSLPSYSTQLKVIYSTNIIPVSSSPSWTSNLPTDSTLIYNLGTIQPNTCKVITINDSIISCNNNFSNSPYIHTGIVTPINVCTPSDSSYNKYTLIQQFSLPISIENIQKENGVTIFPNPFTLETFVSFNEEQKHSIITIIDILGKEIKTISFTGKQLIIEKGEMKSGIYFVRIIDANKNLINKKFILQ